MAIAESTGTCGRRVDDARITVAHPRLMALVAASAEAALASGEAIVTHDFGVLFRGRLRRWIQTRDVSCTFPGCQRLAQRCEIDHVLAYPLGETSHGNGACECVHHHQAKHASIPATRRADGCMVWTNRFGITVVRPPRALLRGW